MHQPDSDSRVESGRGGVLVLGEEVTESGVLVFGEPLHVDAVRSGGNLEIVDGAGARCLPRAGGERRGEPLEELLVLAGGRLVAGVLLRFVLPLARLPAAAGPQP